MFFWSSLAFSMIQRMLAIWSLDNITNYNLSISSNFLSVFPINKKKLAFNGFPLRSILLLKIKLKLKITDIIKYDSFLKLNCKIYSKSVTWLKSCLFLVSCHLSFPFSSVQFSSVAQSYPTLCKPMDCSMPGLPVHHQLLEFTQTHVHWVGDAIQPYHPLLSHSPPSFNLPQHQGLFKWVSSSNQMAKVLEFQLQHQSFQWIFQDWFSLRWTGWMSLQSKGLPRVFPNTTVQKHQFFYAQLSL